METEQNPGGEVTPEKSELNSRVDRLETALMNVLTLLQKDRNLAIDAKMLQDQLLGKESPEKLDLPASE